MLLLPAAVAARFRFSGAAYPERALILKAYLLTAIYNAAGPVFLWIYGAGALLRLNPKLLDTASDGAMSMPQSTPVLLLQIALCYFCTDILFYGTHRLLHDERWYAYVHKQHHLFIHTVPVAATFAHPLEFVFGNVVAVVAGPVLFRTHFSVWLMWMTVALLGTCIAHSGWRLLDVLLPFAPAAARRDVAWHWHHHAKNVGTFGHSQLFDTLFGTRTAYARWCAEQEKLEGAAAAGGRGGGVEARRKSASASVQRDAEPVEATKTGAAAAAAAATKRSSSKKRRKW
jgi:sterol desaturase/sphingolipid hydroxylase (fatty acid hydroxylase superfamily)